MEGVSVWPLAVGPRTAWPVGRRLDFLIPFLWLGELVIFSLTNGANNVRGAVQMALRRWSLGFLSRRLVNMLVFANPALSPEQRGQLLTILEGALDQLLWQHIMDRRLLRSVVALACPNHDTAMLLSYLVEIIAGLAVGLHEGTAPSAAASCRHSNPSIEFASVEQAHCNLRGEDIPQLLIDANLEAGVVSLIEDAEQAEEEEEEGEEEQDEEEEDAVEELVETEGLGLPEAEQDRACSGDEDLREKRRRGAGAYSEREQEGAVLQVLLGCFELDQQYAAAMPDAVRRAVLEALWGCEVSALLRRYIALRELVGEAGQEAGRVLASLGRPVAQPICCITLEPLLLPNCSLPPDVVAVVHHAARNKRLHAYLYKGQALYTWLGASHAHTSPVTRDMVLPTDIYRLS